MDRASDRSSPNLSNQRTAAISGATRDGAR